MKTNDLDRQLLALFTQELKERAEEVERHLLALENAPELDERRSRQETLLRIYHSLKGAAGLVKVRSIETLCHKLEDLLSFLTREGRLLAKADLDMLFAAADLMAEAGRTLEQQEGLADLSIDSMLVRIDERLQSDSVITDDEPLAPSNAPPTRMPAIRRSDSDGSMRLSGEKLDSLLYRSGELVTAKSRLSLRVEQASSLQQRIKSLRSSPLGAQGEAAAIESRLRELSAGISDDLRVIGGLVGEFEYEIRRARMQPFGEVCQGLPRIVRDIGKSSGKSVELRIVGGEIEIDKSIAAGLQDVLRHLVRNAVDHGIESVVGRRKAGKPEAGSVTVSASLNGDRMEVRVADDGRGFDVDSIRKAAGRLGLPEVIDEQQRLRQSFEAGVSTSPELTHISGRGLGLDIVRKAVESMRGTADVSHVPGKGAAFTVTLPLTLTTVQALEVMVAGQSFTIDVASVRKVSRISARDLPKQGESNVIDAEERSIRVLDLAEWLGFPRMAPAGETAKYPVVIVGSGESETAVVVEKIIGQQQLLARSLGERISVRCYAGATVLPDGRVALLLNAAALVSAAISQETFAGESFSVDSPRRKRRILVVDDAPSVRSLEKLILEEAGYEVALAGDGKGALTHLRTQGADLVLADIDMPVMDGLALTQAIRRSRKFADLPVILVTGRDTPGEKAEGLRVGANAYIAKSGFDQQHFLETIGQVL